jgi:hypothetical protein
MSDYYAHTGSSKADWQPLREHLEEVARLARLRLDAARPGDAALLNHTFPCLRGLT